MQHQETYKKGSILIYVIFFVGIFAIISSSLILTVFSLRSSAVSYCNGTKAFYLAEAGAETGKILLDKNPFFYTDLKPKNITVNWLKSEAYGQKQIIPNNKESFKTVIIKDTAGIYGIGFSNGSYAIIKIKGNSFSEL